jgi:hypothetical protein
LLVARIVPIVLLVVPEPLVYRRLLATTPSSLAKIALKGSGPLPVPPLALLAVLVSKALTVSLPLTATALPMLALAALRVITAQLALRTALFAQEVLRVLMVLHSLCV